MIRKKINILLEIGFKAIVKVTPNTSQEQFKNELQQTFMIGNIDSADGDRIIGNNETSTGTTTSPTTVEDEEEPVTDDNFNVTLDTVSQFADTLKDNSSEAAKQLFDKIVEFVLENTVAVTDNIMINLLSYAEHNRLDEDMRALLESGSEQKQVEWLDTLNQQKINKTLLEDQRQTNINTLKAICSNVKLTAWGIHKAMNAFSSLMGEIKESKLNQEELDNLIPWLVTFGIQFEKIDELKDLTISKTIGDQLLKQCWETHYSVIALRGFKFILPKMTGQQEFAIDLVDGKIRATPTLGDSSYEYQFFWEILVTLPKK